jgi:RNA-directed DNA polymerase
MLSTPFIVELFPPAGERLKRNAGTPTASNRKLYRKAKAEPAFRFYLLYDKICREDILRHAYALARSNAGAPGVDGVTFADIDLSGREAWLAGQREELVLKTYR